MALIHCKDCNRPVSSDALHCIHCGCPMQLIMLAARSSKQTQPCDDKALIKPNDHLVPTLGKLDASAPILGYEPIISPPPVPVLGGDSNPNWDFCQNSELKKVPFESLANFLSCNIDGISIKRSSEEIKIQTSFVTRVTITHSGDTLHIDASPTYRLYFLGMLPAAIVCSKNIHYPALHLLTNDPAIFVLLAGASPVLLPILSMLFVRMIWRQCGCPIAGKRLVHKLVSVALVDLRDLRKMSNNDTGFNENGASFPHKKSLVGVIFYGLFSALFLSVAVGLLVKNEHVGYYWDSFLSGALSAFLLYKCTRCLYGPKQQ